jgi:iron(III) transport system substrate-binding protein
VLRFVAVATALVLTGCSTDAGTADRDGDEQPLVIYSGRNENLVGPVVARLEAELGLRVEVRYASSSELAAQLLEEGDATRADLFWSQDAGALGALAKEGMLAELEPFADVPAEFGDQHWVATSGRVRVLAYDPEQIDASAFSSIDDILTAGVPIGYAPSNASFHSFVTALRVDRGDDGAREPGSTRSPRRDPEDIREQRRRAGRR